MNMNNETKNKTIAIGITIFLLSLSSSIVTGQLKITSYETEDYFMDGNTLYVGGNGPKNYTTIQEALDAASDNDTIFVYNGTYNEDIVLDKSIKLIGEDKTNTFIQGDQGNKIIKILSGSSTITGFTVQYQSNDEWDDAALYISSEYNIIHDNIFAHNNLGIFVADWTGDNNTILNNVFSGNYHGIRVDYTFNNKIIGNTIDGKIWALYLENAENTLVTENIFAPTMGTAIRLFFADFNTIINNTIVNGGIGYYGIYLVESHDCIIANNTISDFYYSLYVQSNWEYRFSQKNTIENNTISNVNYPSHGVILEFSPHNTIINNEFESCGINMAGYFVDDFNSHTIEGNTANGKPIYYYKNESGITVPSDAGQVILANSDHCIVSDLNIQNIDSAIQLGFSENNEIFGNIINNTIYGIDIWAYSLSNTISENSITNVSDGGGVGIWFGSEFNTITGNFLFKNHWGVVVSQSNNNEIIGNTIKESNDDGIYFYECYYNTVYHNNFLNNSQNADDPYGNIWDNGYPDGGNYWSDYNGSDEFRGENQNEPGSDGIGDTPYDVPSADPPYQDHYPLMEPWIHLSFPDLDCSGDLSWTEITPGDTVTGEFIIQNIGDQGSLLAWKIDDYPEWGTWTFIPSMGGNLSPDMGELTITLEVIAPEESETEFDGEIKLVNMEDPEDFCTIDISLVTPVNQQQYRFPFIQRLLERFQNLFPFIRHIFNF